MVSRFGFEGMTFVLITSIPGHCLPFTTYIHACALGSGPVVGSVPGK